MQQLEVFAFVRILESCSIATQRRENRHYSRKKCHFLVKISNLKNLPLVERSHVYERVQLVECYQKILVTYLDHSLDGVSGCVEWSPIAPRHSVCDLFVNDQMPKLFLKQHQRICKTTSINENLQYAFCAIHCRITTLPIEHELLAEVFYRRYLYQSLGVLLRSTDTTHKWLAIGEFN